MNERKGFVLAIVFFLITILTTGFGVFIYFLKQEKEDILTTLQVRKALKSAESCVEKALVRIKNGNYSNFTDNTTNDLICNCTIKKTSSSTYNIVSEVKNEEVSVTIEVTANKTNSTVIIKNWRLR